MKIDVHAHTKKTKKGDAKTREIDAHRFHEIIASTDVKIVAITNHNLFDLEQYNDFTETVGGDFQIWPGVELDILENNRRGHLLVIVSPNHAQLMAKIMDSLCKETTPDDFNISIGIVISNFDKLNPLYIAHYNKMPDLLDEDVEKIIAQTAHKSRVLKEATNSISAGIFLRGNQGQTFIFQLTTYDNYDNKDREDFF